MLHGMIEAPYGVDLLSATVDSIVDSDHTDIDMSSMHPA